MKATFEHSVDVLVKAYLNNTLAHRICTACAVGNLVADALGGKVPKKAPGIAFDNQYYDDGYMVKWAALSETFPQWGSHEKALEEIEKTGYTVDQINKIEYAFEMAPRNCPSRDHLNEEWMFNGLMAVVDVLADIHSIDLTSKEEAKKLFVKV